MYKVFLKFPDALRPAFPRLKEKLEDPDPGVWFCCAVIAPDFCLLFDVVWTYICRQSWFFVYVVAMACAELELWCKLCSHVNN